MDAMKKYWRDGCLNVESRTSGTVVDSAVRVTGEVRVRTIGKSDGMPGECTSVPACVVYRCTWQVSGWPGWLLLPMACGVRRQARSGRTEPGTAVLQPPASSIGTTRTTPDTSCVPRSDIGQLPVVNIAQYQTHHTTTPPCHPQHARYRMRRRPHIDSRIGTARVCPVHRARKQTTTRRAHQPCMLRTPTPASGCTAGSRIRTLQPVERASIVWHVGRGRDRVVL